MRQVHIDVDCWRNLMTNALSIWHSFFIVRSARQFFFNLLSIVLRIIRIISCRVAVRNSLIKTITDV